MFPDFMITDNPQFSYDGWRNVYIDEIKNSFWFRRSVNSFVSDVLDDADEMELVMVINGYVDVDGNAEQKCKASNLIPQGNKVLLVESGCVVRS